MGLHAGREAVDRPLGASLLAAGYALSRFVRRRRERLAPVRQGHPRSRWGAARAPIIWRDGDRGKAGEGAGQQGRNAARYARALAVYMETAKRGSMAEEYGVTLTHYMVNEKGRDGKPTAERVLGTGALVSGKVVDWQAGVREVEARMAKRSSRSKKPARHLVGSVRVGEDISPEACDHAAAILADELGCEAGVILWALHGDTDNRHLHVLVLTLDEHGAATPFGREGRSYEAMQRAIARIEDAHRFAREAGARYAMCDGKVERLSPKPKAGKARTPISTATLQWEAETGVESFTRYAQDRLAPLIDEAGSWHDVQSALAPLGARIMKAGSGGQIESGDGYHKVKLTSVDRAMAWRKLTERWGGWSEPTTVVALYEPRILDPERALRWARRDEQAEPLHDAVQMRIDRLKLERKAALCETQRDYKKRRGDLAALPGDPLDLADLRQSIDRLERRRLAQLKRESADRIAALRDLRAEIREADSLDDVSLDDIAAFERSLAIDWACRPVQVAPPPGFATEIVGEAIHYWRDDVRAGRPAFVERGDRIWLNDDTDVSIRAALLVAQARYGVVAAYGDAAFVAQVQRLGRELGMAVQHGAVQAKVPRRARSPRVQQRRDAIRRRQAVPDLHQSARPHEHFSRGGGDNPHPAPTHGPIETVDRSGQRLMSDAIRQAQFARIRRMLAADDWDARDYRRTTASGTPRGRGPAQHASERHSSSAASRHARREAPGAGR